MNQNTLFVCVLCRLSGNDSTQSTVNPGQLLFDQLRQKLLDSKQPEIQLQPVRCLGACRHGCAAAFAAPHKLTFILSELSPTESVSDLLQFATQYAACQDGKVPFRERPETVKQKIHAVLPILPTAPQQSSSC